MCERIRRYCPREFGNARWPMITPYQAIAMLIEGFVGKVDSAP